MLFFQALSGVASPLLVYDLEGSQFRLQEAIPILCPLSIPLIREPQRGSEFAFDDDGRGLLFEYDPLQVGVIPEDRYSPHNARGIWIVRKGNCFWCRVFTADTTNAPGSFSATRGHRFILEEGKELPPIEIPRRRTGAEDQDIAVERDSLGIALGLLVDVAKERRRLLKPKRMKPFRVLTEHHIDYGVW